MKVNRKNPIRDIALASHSAKEFLSIRILDVFYLSVIVYTKSTLPQSPVIDPIDMHASLNLIPHRAKLVLESINV